MSAHLENFAAIPISLPTYILVETALAVEVVQVYNLLTFNYVEDDDNMFR